MSEKAMSFISRDSTNCLRLSCVVFDWRQVELGSLERLLKTFAFHLSGLQEVFRHGIGT